MHRPARLQSPPIQPHARPRQLRKGLGRPSRGPDLLQMAQTLAERHLCPQSPARIQRHLTSQHEFIHLEAARQ